MMSHDRPWPDTTPPGYRRPQIDCPEVALTRPSHRSSPRAGQRVGPFELAELLSSGQGSSLYRAVRPAGSREPRVVAVRIADHARDERATAWIRHEYDVLRALDDPRIPKAYGFYSSQVAVAVTCIEGCSLAEALRARREGQVPLDVATTIDILIEITHALRHAHSSTVVEGGVVHGHLAPDHVLLDQNGRLILMGLGTDRGEPVLGYTAPEQAAGAFLDPRTDQWAVGALGVEMVLGRPLYDDSSDPSGDALQGRVGAALDRIERRVPALARVLARLLAPAAGDRFADEGELIRVLLEVGRTLGGRADRAALVGRVVAARPAPEPEVAPQREPAPSGTDRTETDRAATAPAEPPPAQTGPAPSARKPNVVPPRGSEVDEDDGSSEPTTVMSRPAVLAPEPRAKPTPTLVPDPADEPPVSSAEVMVEPDSVLVEPDSVLVEPDSVLVEPDSVLVEPDSAHALEGALASDGASAADPALAGLSFGAGDVEVTDPLGLAPRRGGSLDPSSELADQPTTVMAAIEFERRGAAGDAPAEGGPAIVGDTGDPEADPNSPHEDAGPPSLVRSEIAAVALVGLLVVVGLVYMAWRFG
jgi:serine/threonine protein kinase